MGVGSGLPGRSWLVPWGHTGLGPCVACRVVLPAVTPVRVGVTRAMPSACAHGHVSVASVAMDHARGPMRATMWIMVRLVRCH